MSATNRGNQRISRDAYQTPKWAIETFLQARPLRGTEQILEPAAGIGNIVTSIQHHYPRVKMDCVEIDPNFCRTLSEIEGINITCQDFLTVVPETIPDVVITNPPYSLAKEFILHSFEVSGPRTEIIMLLRLAFLESKTRKEFWKKYTPDSIYVLSRRPSFIGSGTDATAYAWFVWNSQRSEYPINVI